MNDDTPTRCTGCRTTLTEWDTVPCRHGLPFCGGCPPVDHCEDCYTDGRPACPSCGQPARSSRWPCRDCKNAYRCCPDPTTAARRLCGCGAK